MIEFDDIHVRIGDIRDALAAKFDQEETTGLDENAVIMVLGHVYGSDVDMACSMCGGDGAPEPEPVVNHALIGEFIAALQAGDMLTARGLVYRVFDDTSDARAADSALCRCAT